MAKIVSDFETKDGFVDQFASATKTSKGAGKRIPKAVAILDKSQNHKFATVVTSGQDSFVKQLIQIPWDNNIKVREDGDLAKMLTAMDVDSDIPIEAFAGIVEILSYVYRASAGLVPLEEEKN